MEKAIQWFTRNHVAGNFLMLAVLLAGFTTWFKLKKEIFPETAIDAVAVRLPYPNATPEEVKNGHGLAAALGRWRQFPRLALQMMQVGEESGALDAMLLRAADTFEQESAQAIDRLLAALVPALTLLLAAVVGGVIIAVLVPLYYLTNAIG